MKKSSSETYIRMMLKLLAFNFSFAAASLCSTFAQVKNFFFLVIVVIILLDHASSSVLPHTCFVVVSRCKYGAKVATVFLSSVFFSYD